MDTSTLELTTEGSLLLSHMNTTQLDVIKEWPLAIQITVPILCVIVFGIVVYILHIVDDPGLKKDQAYSKVALVEGGDTPLPATSITNSVPDNEKHRRHTLSESSPRRDSTNKTRRERNASTGSQTQSILEGYLMPGRRSVDLGSSGSGGGVFSLAGLVRKSSRARSKSTSEAVVTVPHTAARRVLGSKGVGGGFGMIQEEGGFFVDSEEASVANIDKNNATIC